MSNVRHPVNTGRGNDEEVIANNYSVGAGRLRNHSQLREDAHFLGWRTRTRPCSPMGAADAVLRDGGAQVSGLSIEQKRLHSGNGAKLHNDFRGKHRVHQSCRRVGRSKHWPVLSNNLRAERVASCLLAVRRQ
jgi:hypothetical protein